MDEYAEQLVEMRRRLEHPEAGLNAVASDVIRPALVRNFRNSGIKSQTGTLYRGITQPGARGHYERVSGDRVTIGVDYNLIRYARWVLEGRGPVVARKAKALRFVINGRMFFRKRVGPAPARPVMYLTTADEQQAQQRFERYVVEGR